MNMSKKWKIINTLISAACAIICTVFVGCKLVCDEMSVKGFFAELSIMEN